MTGKESLTFVNEMNGKTPFQIGFAFNVNIDFANVVETLSNLESSIKSLQSSISSSSAVPQGENKFVQIDWGDTDSSEKDNSIYKTHSEAEEKNKLDGGGSKHISDKQKATIQSMCENREYDPEKYAIDCIGKKLDELCGSEANKLIKSLKGVKHA